MKQFTNFSLVCFFLIDYIDDMFNMIILEFETIYVGDNPENISRYRLCIFQLIHMPMHIAWFGSIRLGSQATVERAIGEMGHQIRSKKAPFSQLANLVLERELLRLLLLYHPELDPKKPGSKRNALQPFSERKIKKTERSQDNSLAPHIQAICQWLKIPFTLDIPLKRWSKLLLVNGKVLSSLGLPSQPARVSYYFEAKRLPAPLFGQAIGFFQASDAEQILVLFYLLVDAHLELGRWVGRWSTDISVLPVTDIVDLVGVFVWNKARIHILQKYASFSMLSPDELGLEDSGDDED